MYLLLLCDSFAFAHAASYAQVSSSGSSDVQRSPLECEIRWRGSANPQFVHMAWSQAEIAKVRELVGTAKPGEIDWVAVAKKLEVSLSPTGFIQSRRFNIDDIYTD